jgi:transposase
MIPTGAKQTELEKLDPRSLSEMVVRCLAHIEHLELIIVKLRRQHFGPRSEKTDANDEQLELGLDGVQAVPVVPTDETQTEAAEPQQPVSRSRKSRALPGHLRREIHTHLPEQSNCPDCGGTMKKLGEDVSEMLEYIPASFFVIRHVRPKLSCVRCSSVVQAPAPSRPVDRGLLGPGILAHVITAKYSDYVGFPVM